MSFTLLAPVLFGLIAASVTGLGLLLVAWQSRWTARHASLFGIAAGGMLVTLTLMHITPEALGHGGPAGPALILAGFLIGTLATAAARLVAPLGPHSAASLAPPGALGPLIAVALHSLIDGAVYSATFVANAEAGIYAATALTLHEVPEAVVAFALMRQQGAALRPALFWAFLAAGLTTPLGAALSLPVVHLVAETLRPGLLALSAGLLLYVATGPLLSPLRESPQLRGLVALGVGLVAGLVLLRLPLHAHTIDTGEAGPHAHVHDAPSGHDHAHPHPLRFSPHPPH